jgi:uncharacterized protein
LHYDVDVKLISLALLLLLSAGCSTEKPPEGMIRAALVRGDIEIPLWVEVADDPEERTQNHGMLFVFDSPRKLSFWMKNTLIPLDILYFDNQFDFLNALTMVPCVSDPCPTYPSRWPAQYALEVRKDFVREYTIERGWSLRVDLVQADMQGSGGVVSGE